MNLLSPQNYIPSNISTSMDELQVSLRSAPVQLQKVYRQKYSSDVVLKFSGKQYLAHRYVLQKTSNLFSHGFMAKNGEKWQVDVKAKGKTEIFTKILSCMYGYSTTIRRYDIHEAYDIAKAFQIQSLLSQFENDMMSHFDQYDIFPLLKLANKENLQELSDLCYDQLEIEMFEPMRYNKSGLFLCDGELFKSIIKRHNWRKWNNEKFGLSQLQIRQLIDDYCFVNGVGKQEKKIMIEELSNQKENMRYHAPLNQVFRKPSTPSRIKSTSEIFQRNTLTLPREKDPQKNPYLFPKGRRLSPCVSSFHKSNGELQSESQQSNNEKTFLGSSPLITKSEISDKSNSLSNISTENLSQQNRSRRQSSGSVETISNSKENGLILEIFSKQNALRQSQQLMKLRALQMLKKLTTKIEQSREKGLKLHKLQGSLEELKAQIVCSREKVKQLQRTVKNVQTLQNQKNMKQKFQKLFEVNTPLNLTLSTQISIKKPLRV